MIRHITPWGGNKGLITEGPFLELLGIEEHTPLRIIIRPVHSEDRRLNGQAVAFYHITLAVAEGRAHKVMIAATLRG